MGGRWWRGKPPRSGKYAYASEVIELTVDGEEWIVHWTVDSEKPEGLVFFKLRAKGEAPMKANYWLRWSRTSGRFMGKDAEPLLVFRPVLARRVAETLARRFGGVVADAQDAGSSRMSDAAHKADQKAKRRAEKEAKAKARQTRKEWLAGMEERKAARLEREAAKRVEDLKRMNTDPRHRKKGFRLLNRPRVGADA